MVNWIKCLNDLCKFEKNNKYSFYVLCFAFTNDIKYFFLHLPKIYAKLIRINPSTTNSSPLSGLCATPRMYP